MANRRRKTNSRTTPRSTIDTGVVVMLAAGNPIYDRGDIIETFRLRIHPKFIWDSETLTFSREGGVLSPNTGIIYVRNVPQQYFIRLHRIVRPEYNEPTNSEDLYSGRMKRARRWRFQVAELSQANRDELLATKQLNRTWIQFKNRTINRRTSQYLDDLDLEDVDRDPTP